MLGPGPYRSRWREVAQMWHFSLRGYPGYLMDWMERERGIRLTWLDFYPDGSGRYGGLGDVPEPAMLP